MGIGVETEKEKINCDAVILATGGMSYPVTGSTGDGYYMAEELGHKITELKPSLVAMTSKEETLEICQELQGLTLKNVAIEVFENNKKVYDDFGEMLFTHFGVSGPIILSSSAHLVRYPNINRLLAENKIKLYIDLKPALTFEELDVRVLRDFEEFKNKE